MEECEKVVVISPDLLESQYLGKSINGWQEEVSVPIRANLDIQKPANKVETMKLVCPVEAHLQTGQQGMVSSEWMQSSVKKELIFTMVSNMEPKGGSKKTGPTQLQPNPDFGSSPNKHPALTPNNYPSPLIDDAAVFEQEGSVKGFIEVDEVVAAITPGLPEQRDIGDCTGDLREDLRGGKKEHQPEECVETLRPNRSIEDLLQIGEGESLQQFLVNEEGTKTIQETQAGWNGSVYVGLLDHLPSPIPGPTQNNSFTHLPAHQQQTFSPSDELHRWGQTRPGVRQGTKTEWKGRRRKGLGFLRRIAALEVLKSSDGETAEMEECHEELHSIKFIGTTNGISTLMPVNRGTKPIFILLQLLLVLGNQQGVPAFTVPQPDEAMCVLEEKAYKLDVPLQVVPPLDPKLLNGLKLGLEGVHQFLNAGLAVALCWKWLEKTGHLGASYLEQTSCLPEQFIKGLTTACLHGRAQIVPDRCINSESDGDLVFYLDGAHSPEIMEACAGWFSIAIKDESLGTLNFPSDKNSESTVELVEKNHDRKSRKNLMQILLFNCMSVRNPQLLLQRLMKSGTGHGVYFKKALFVIRLASFWRTFLSDSTAPSTFKFLSRCINGIGLSRTRQYFGDLERTLKTVGSNVLFAAATKISDYVLKGAEVSGLDGRVSGFHQGILKLAMEPSLLGTALMEGGPDKKIKIDRSPGISTSVLRTRLFPLGGNDGDNATSPGIQTRGPPYDKGKCKRHEGWHKEDELAPVS